MQDERHPHAHSTWRTWKALAPRGGSPYACIFPARAPAACTCGRHGVACAEPVDDAREPRQTATRAHFHRLCNSRWFCSIAGRRRPGGAAVKQGTRRAVAVIVAIAAAACSTTTAQAFDPAVEAQNFGKGNERSAIYNTPEYRAL